MSKKYKNNTPQGNSPMDAIKAYEASLKKAAPAETADNQQRIDIDQWWAMRNPELEQPQHIKEVLAADAAARGLEKVETLERWDWAAKIYGLKF